MPFRNKTTVSKAPTIKGGDKLKATFRPAAEQSGVAVLRALRSRDQPAMSSAMTASTSQVNNQRLTSGSRAARYADRNAGAPIATCPHPGTAVHAEARS